MEPNAAKEIKDRMTSLMREGLDHKQSSLNLLKNERGTVTPELLEQYPDSPTAQITVLALKMVEFGFFTLCSYQKDRVLTDEDCQILQPGFHNYVRGYMHASHILKQYPTALLPQNIGTWTEDYMKMRPNDTVVEYFYVSIIIPMRAIGKSDYEACKEYIRALEQFAHKLEEYKSVESERRLLSNAYHVLGSRYMSTEQRERAFDSFKKQYELDSKDIFAIYGYAYSKKEDDPTAALELFEKLLSVAPKCHEKYANTLYLMAWIHFSKFKNKKQMQFYFKKAKDAEKYRMPFDGAADIPQKEILEMIMLAPDKAMELPEIFGM